MEKQSPDSVTTRDSLAFEPRESSGPEIILEATDPFLGRTMGGRYHIESLLGAGSMGRVYRATQRPLDKAVAVKVLNASLAADPAAAPRFLREARAASRFDHPNSVAVFDFGHEPDGTAFIAMEYLRGESLEALLAREGALPPERCVAILSQVLAALAEAHEHGVVHRDLKPENIMLVHEGGEDGDVVKVTDFGIATVLDGASARITATGFTPGSPAYMSPEQVQARPVDGRSDLYQCGAILFEMVTGQTPFTAENVVGLLMQHVNAPVPSPHALNPRCPPGLERVIFQAMQKDPARRYSSAREMRHALREVAPGVVATTGEVASPTSSATAPRGRRSPRWWLADSVVVAATCALIALTGHADPAVHRAARVVASTSRSTRETRTEPPAPVTLSSATPSTESMPARPDVATAVHATPRRFARRAPVRRSAVVSRAVPRQSLVAPVELPPVAAPPEAAVAVAPAPRVVPVSAPPPVAPPMAPLRGIGGSLIAVQVSGGITQGAVRSKATAAVEAVARCAYRRSVGLDPSATRAPVTLAGVVSVRDRRADSARLTGGPLADGCRDALLRAFDGELPAGIDTDYEVRLSIALAPRR